MANLWPTLDAATQFRLALDLATLRLPQWRRRYPNVVAAGAGYRLRGNTRHEEICVRIVVERKWTGRARSGAARAGALPSVLRVALPGGGGRHALIPVDVVERPRGRPASTLALTDGVRVVDGSRDLGAGSICCLVRDAQRPGDRYLLSCHHVLTGSGALPDFSVDPNALTTLPDGEVIATLAQWAPLRFTVGFGTDAALARVVEPEVTDISAWGRGIRRVGALAELPRPLFLLARRMTRTASGQPVVRTAPLPAQMVGVDVNVRFNYGNRQVGITRVIQYEAATEGGDSGAALVGADGSLYGMHFYEDAQGRSYALTVTELFLESPFAIDIRLVSG
jgi:hypothetical protein